MARRYVRDKKGRFASKSGGRGSGSAASKDKATTNKATSKPSPPKEPHVLEIGGERRVFSNSNQAITAYMSHISSGGKGEATLWNSGRVQAKTTPKVRKTQRKSAARIYKNMSQM